MKRTYPNFISLIRILAISFLLVVFSINFSQKSFAIAGINRTINFQGKLVNNPTATNVTDTSYTVIFTIYDRASGGTALWTETQTVTTVDGIFRVALGSQTAFPTNFNFNWDGLYLGMKVNADDEMTPRIQLAAVPYAFNSQKVAGLTVLDSTSSAASTSATLKLGDATTPKTFDLGANDLTFSTSGSTSLTLPTAGTLLTNTATAVQTITSTQTTGTVLGIADSTGLTGSITGLNVAITSSTNSQNKTGISFDLSGGTGGTYYDLLGTGSTWSITRAGVLTVASCTGCGGVGSTNWWNEVSGNGVSNGGYLTPNNSTTDFLLGAQSTTSAKFAVLNLNSGTPVASIAGNLVIGQGAQIRSQYDNLNLAYKSGGDAWTTGITLQDVTGFVGISNANPTANLDVTGTASVSGTLTIGNGTTNQLRSAYGPLQLQYKSAADGWATGLSVEDTTGKVIISNGLTLTSGPITLGGSTGTGQCLTGGATASWGSCGGTNFFVDGGAFAYLDSTYANDLVLGGTTVAGASFYFDADVGLYLGTNESLNGLLTFYSSGAGITDPTISTDASGNLNLAANQSGASVVVGSGVGDIILDPGTAKVGIGITASLQSQLHVTRPLSDGATGKALAIFDQIEDQDIFTASKAGVTKFTIDQNGGASMSGTLTIANGQAIRSAFGPLNLSYKSAADAWTTGLSIEDITGRVIIPGAVLGGTYNGLTVTANGTNTLNIAAGKTLIVSNSLTLAGTDSTSFTFPSTTGGTVLTTNQASQTITSTQTSGTVLGITDSTALVGAIKGAVITLSGTGVQDQTGLEFNLSNATGTNLNDIMGSGTTWKVSKLGAATFASISSGGNLAFTGTNPSITNTGSNTLTLNSGSTGDLQFFSSSYKITSGGALTVSSCTGCGGGGSTLQQAYDAGSAGDQVITLDSTQDSLVFRNPSSSGTDSTYVLKIEQLNTGDYDNLTLTNSGTGSEIAFLDATSVIEIPSGGAIKFVDDAHNNLNAGFREYFGSANYGAFEANGFINIDGTFMMENFNSPGGATQNTYTGPALTGSNRLGASGIWEWHPYTGNTTAGCQIQLWNTASNATVNGVVQLSPATNASGCWMFMQPNWNTQTAYTQTHTTAGVLDIAYKFVMYYKAKLSTEMTQALTNRFFYFGADNYHRNFLGANTATEATWGGIWISNVTYTSSATGNAGLTQWAGVARLQQGSAATQIQVATCGQNIVGGAYFLARIEARATNDVHFFMDNDVSNGITLSECGTGVTQGIPTNGVLKPSIYLGNVSAATTRGTVFLDFVAYVQDDPRPDASQGVAGASTGPDSTSVSPSSPDPINGADIAEKYQFERLSEESLDAEPGDVVVLSDKLGHAKRASREYDRKLLGVVAESPALILGEGNDNSLPVAISGRVPVKVSSASGEIKIGDPLTSSKEKGAAVKAIKPGKILGTAMENFNASESGKILVNVNTGYYIGDEGDTVLLEQKEEMVLGSSTIATESGSLTQGNLGSTESSTTNSLPLLSRFSIQGMFEALGEAIFKGPVEFFSNVTFHSKVTFADRVEFDKDTAGKAIIKKGQRFVDVTFEKEYENEPIVNISLVIPKMNEDLFKQKVSEGFCDEVEGIAVCQDKLADALLGSNNRYAIISKSNQGFMILLEKTASTEMSFSWQALAVKDVKLSSNNGPRDLSLPIKGNYKLTNRFGQLTDDPVINDGIKKANLKGHDGIDLAASSGTDVLAVDDGEVVAPEGLEYGTTLVVKHSWGKSFYGHLSKADVKVGNKVSKGQKIGEVGNSGISTGPHLHFGMAIDGASYDNGYLGKMDPLLFLPDLAAGQKLPSADLTPTPTFTQSSTLESSPASSSSAN